MESFLDIYERACERKGSKDILESLLSEPVSNTQLAMLPDDVWLEEFTRKIFQSGFYWSVINAKWSGFRDVFWDFSIEKLLYMSPEMFEQRAQDERIVRNYKKVQSIAHNCLMLHELALEHGTFSKLVANWPEDNIIELWLLLKKQGSRLGGNTGPYALRAVGKDTFILSRDVEAYLRAHEVVSGGLHSQKSLRSAQAFFNELRRQSGYSLQKLSQLVAYSVGDNEVGVTS
ncbi:DNA-3-methyladenine glycosylase I [Pseudoalteromonas rubra]|uniref:DNA-3-methyladenine glycosylase I n=1 Tax=Pseudoalteromonas rubra TaxID=43658 RepID=UPI002DB87475|nr:DNA-3-methyladenine glycosylase I [Pseudoalteromonas rubra]MEC4091759.1 DNA-3-methyladenine glycosylase I [Pseudoalteromonas rubra]